MGVYNVIFSYFEDEILGDFKKIHYLCSRLTN